MLLIKNFLNNRFKPILLNGQISDLLHAKASAPQGFILEPVFFLVHIYDLPNDLASFVSNF